MLKAPADSGSIFAGWSGGGCSGTGLCTVTMDASKTVTATFTASSSTPPTANTGTAQPNGETTALLFGTVNPNGAATDVWFEWGTTTFYGNTTLHVAIGTGISAVQQTPQITNLVPGGTYHFRIVGENSQGTRYGNDMSFTMPAVALAKPTVSTGNVTNKSMTFATLEGVVNPNGAPASIWFEWGITSNYGNTTPVFSYGGTGTTDITSSQIITGLSAGATYHFRIVAENAAGRSQGADQIFVTQPQTVTPHITSVSPNPAVATGSAQPFTINGSSFVSGATVTLRTSGGGVYANRAISSQTATQIVINPNFGTIQDTWTVEVINPGSISSGQFTFMVRL